MPQPGTTPGCGMREELAETRKELADSQVKCAQLEDNPFI